MAEKFLLLDQVSVQMGGRLLLDNLTLTINRGEQWVITGPSGSGKTLLAHTLSGRHFYTGRIGYYFGGQEETAVEARADKTWATGYSRRIVLVEQQHRFKTRPGATDLYYQQRFN